MPKRRKAFTRDDLLVLMMAGQKGLEMIWIVEYAMDGKRHKKKFESEYEAEKFCEKLSKLVKEDKCGGYFIGQKGN